MTAALSVRKEREGADTTDEARNGHTIPPV